MPITLTKPAVRAAVKRACERGRLAAMNGQGCPQYHHDNGDMCAIGAILPAKITDEYEGQTVHGLIDEGVISARNGEWLQDLQLAHDSWSTNAHNAKRVSRTEDKERNAKWAKQYRATFFSLLGIPDKYGGTNANEV